MPILYDFKRVPSRNTSMRKAGMLTTMRVSLGIAFGPFKSTGSSFAIGWSLLSAGEGLIAAGLLAAAAGPSFVQLENAKMSEIIATVRGIWCFISFAFNLNPIPVAMRLATQRSCVEPQLVAPPQWCRCSQTKEDITSTERC